MVRFGYTLFSELNGPADLVSQARSAEEAGFAFAGISDHFHPWLDSHSDSPFAWSVLGAVAERTDRLDLMTLVTCPFLRYHPAIIAQAAATVAVMSDGRFTLGIGAGERLNEHVVGAGWPPADIRHEMLTESLEAMRALWEGEFTTYRGTHVTVEDARLYTVPDRPPQVAIAASGTESAGIAARLGDGIIAVEPDGALLEDFAAQGGRGKRRIGQIPLAYDADEAAAQEYAMRFKFGLPGWKAMAELPNPVNFEAAVSAVRQEDVLGLVPAGPDPDVHVRGIRQFVDAGFDEVAVVQIGDDMDGFFRFWQEEVAPRLRDG